MRDSKKKGQFFLLGAFIFIVAFYVGIYSIISPPGLESDPTKDMQNLFDNIGREYPRALNLGMVSSEPVETLMNFTALVTEKTVSANVDCRIAWIVTMNDGGGLNVTVGNFMGEAMDFVINVSGDVENVNVNHDSADSVLFPSPPEEFEMRVSFNTTQKNLILGKRKVNFYAYVSMQKNDNLIMGDVLA